MTPSRPSVRVVLVDDHPPVRAGLRAILEHNEGFDVVAEAGDGEAAILAAREHGPDVVLIDLQMPKLDGIEATRRIRQHQPGIAVLVLTMFEDDESVISALRAGASGYLLKGAEQDEIVTAVRTVAGGGAVFGPAVATRVIDLFANPPPTSPPAFPELTEREREILERVARGDDNRAIGRRLGLSPKTVANNVSNILTKLHLTDRSQAVARARDAGLGKQP